MKSMKEYWTPNMFLMAEALDNKIRMVGGAVRDICLQQNPKDYDFCTPFLAGEVMERLWRIPGVKVLPTGLTHGTVTTCFPNGEKYEVTTLRIDVKTDGRHATVEFTDSWYYDAARRDFTINAMSMDTEGEIYDYFDGVKDLKNKNIKFVGDADTRIKEDYLRILRYFRFQAKYGHWGITFVGKEIDDNIQGLTKLSIERVWSELKQILMIPNNWETICHMMNHYVFSTLGIFNHQGNRATRGFYKDEFEFYKTPETRLAYLVRCIDPKADLEVTFDNLKASRLEKERACFVLNQAPTITAKQCMIHLIEGVPREYVVEASGGINYWRNAVILVFPVSGKTLLDMGYKGVEISNALRYMKQKWYDSEFSLQNIDLLLLLKESEFGRHE